MIEVEHAVIVTNITDGGTKFWIKTDRLFDEKSNDLFMYKFIFVNKNDANWKRYIFVIYRFSTLSEYEKEYTSDGVNDTYRYNRCFKVDSIRFDLNGKNIIVSKIFHTISLNELQAIIQQCKELGWIS